jgi:hypothetical protein
MNYVPVLGVAPSQSVITPVSHYFKDYLISIAEPTTSRGWTLQDIHKQMKKIEKMKLDNMKLYLDSGGYQIITGHITERRIKEYTDVYHMILRQYHDSIEVIFSLDINTPKFSQDKLLKYNDYSIQESLKLHKEIPSLTDKQLFVVQSRFPNILEDWLTLMDKHQVGSSFTRYSFGGLVGLKGEIKSHFNHFVPMTIWLLTYLKTREQPAPKQIHMLGQSSRLAIITGIILEKLFGVEITMDSSEIIRFRPIAAKTPMVVKKDNYEVVSNLTDMQAMIDVHSDPKAHEELEKMKSEILDGKVSNQTFVELISQNLDNLIKFGNQLVQDKDINDIINWTKEDFENHHEIFRMGRLSTEMANNMRLIRIMKPYHENNDFDGIHKHTKTLIANYYSGEHIKTGDIYAN